MTGNPEVIRCPSPDVGSDGRLGHDLVQERGPQHALNQWKLCPKNCATLGVHPKIYVQLASKTPYPDAGFEGLANHKGNRITET